MSQIIPFNDTRGSSQTSYAKDRQDLLDFIKSYSDATDGDKYMDYVRMVASGELKVIEIELDDVIGHFGQAEMASKIMGNTKRYLNVFCDVIDEILLQDPTYTSQQSHESASLFDVVAQQLSKFKQSTPQDSIPQFQFPKDFPKSLIRRYDVTVIAPRKTPISPLRSVKASFIGKLVLVRGIVSRTGDVRPELKVAVYICDHCAKEHYQSVDTLDFAPKQHCTETPGCKGSLVLQMRSSKFVKFQEVAVQEISQETPVGSIPRTLKLHVRGELVQKCSPGDQIQITGVYLQAPPSGVSALLGIAGGATYIEALNIERNKKRYEEMAQHDELTKHIRNDVEQHESSPYEMYTKLAKSIAPEIFGHLDVKKALLLMLISGVSHQKSQSVKIRGDINICLMGDPGVAKSQLLRYVSMLSPRGIYTSGKGSSGVGLTAAIVKDALTSDLVLEGGALVLADNGICCIDEFDKMSDYDRTALHEVMEQQSVSIAKAGITTTLNARASVLAAANPAFGRYNPKKSPMENINIPAALLSRFDLLFLLLDKPEESVDSELAKHILHVHRSGSAPKSDESSEQFLSLSYVRCFIAMAKEYEPLIPKHLGSYMADIYVEMRQEDQRDANQTEYTTPRTLLAIIRLSQALARLRFSNDIAESDIDEAKRLIRASKSSLLDTHQRRFLETGGNVLSQCYDLIRRNKKEDSNVVRLADVRAMLAVRRLTENDLQRCLDEYETLAIWIVNPERTTVEFL